MCYTYFNKTKKQSGDKFFLFESFGCTFWKSMKYQIIKINKIYKVSFIYVWSLITQPNKPTSEQTDQILDWKSNETNRELGNLNKLLWIKRWRR